MPNPPPAWPRALRPDLAAAYVGLSRNSFERHCTVPPIHVTPSIKAWLREDLDRWLDERAGRVAGSPEGNPWHT
jgi:hypothetical protein